MSDTVQARAAARGIETEYWDIFGERHTAPAPLLEAILASLGPAEGSSSLIPPTLVLSAAAPVVPVSLPPDFSGGELMLDITFEDGTRRSLPFALDAPAASTGSQLVPLPPLPLGYHRVQARAAGLSAAAHLIATPDRAWFPSDAGEMGFRAGGLAISVYGLRSPRNWGAGDFTDLETFLAWAAPLGCSFVSLNPLHSIANRAPYNTSPYLPNSVFFRNFLYLDIERIPEFAHSSAAQRDFASPGTQTEIAALRAAPFVEYERVAALKLRFLKTLFADFFDSGGPRDSDFLRYLETEGEPLRRFAIHAALDEAMRAANPEVWNWRSWPEEFRHPLSPAVEAFALENSRAVLLHQWIQWRIDIQLAGAQRRAVALGMRIGLYHDLALATDRFGADLWANPEFFIDGCRVGAPPDSFSPNGQDWAFPPPNSDAHLRDGYRLFAASLRQNLQHGGALRIDHVMRFFRLYWIPDGVAARDGAYVLDRYENLVRILALESVRHRVIVVGEDLGTVPEIARETLTRFGILGYRLFYFERDTAGRFLLPREYPTGALVSVSTHDLPTLAGFWEGADIEARRSAGVLPDEASHAHAWEERQKDKQTMLDLLHGLALLPHHFPRKASTVQDFSGDLHNAIVGFLAITPSRLFVLNQEDLFKDPIQQNLPGTTAEYPNWRHKMKYALDELGAGIPAGCAAMFRDWLAASQRLPAPTPPPDVR